MNINEYKKYLKSVHNTLDDPSMNNQMRDRLKESPVCDMKEYKPDATKYKSSHEPTTASGDSLRPNSKTAEKMEKLKEEEEVEISECVVEYFENYFGDNLNEDTSDEDIMGAVYDLIDLTEAVCEAATFIPNDPDVDKYWGGKKKADELRRRLGQTVVGDKKIERKIPKVKITKKKATRKKATRKKEGQEGQLELFGKLFAANQYFEEYFGQELNENISQNDIMDAVEDLVYLCEAVCDAVGLDEAFTRHASSDASRRVDVVPGKSKVDVNRNFNRKVFGDKEYIKPSPEQLRTALAAQAELKDPVLILKGRDKWGGHLQQKKITGQDIRNKAGDKRIKRMANFRMR